MSHHYFLIWIPILGHVLVHSVDKTHVLVVTVELVGLLFLNTFSFNFAPTPNKPLGFTRFRRSYVNHPAVVLTNHCQSYTALCALFKVARFLFFCSCLSPMIVHLHDLYLLSRLVARMLLTPRMISRRKDVKYLSINRSKLTLGVKHSISCNSIS